MIIDKEIEMTRKNLEENLNNLIHNTEISQKYIKDRIGTIDKRMATLPQYRTGVYQHQTTVRHQQHPLHFSVAEKG